MHWLATQVKDPDHSLQEQGYLILSQYVLTAMYGALV